MKITFFFKKSTHRQI